MAGGLTAGGLGPASAHPADRARSGVVVVGAGMAGITAARGIQRAGHRVQVLEVRDRVGGRIHSWRGWPDTTLDLGASWIHGYAAGNPVTPLARRADARLVPSSYSSWRLHIDARLEAAGLTRSQEGRWAAVVRRAERAARRGPHDVSLAKAVRREVRDLDLSKVERADLAFYLNANYTTEWGGEPDELSARTVDQGLEYGETGEDAILPDGYDQVTDFMARRLSVHTGVRVRRIVLRAGGVDVHTNAGTLRARAAVVTVPLGVLEAEGIDFRPALPHRVEQAIDRLETGVLSKTFLRFPEPFWPERIDWQEYLGPRHGAWAEWFSLAKSGPPALLCFHGGDRARALEAADPADVRAEAMRVLRRMFGSDIPDPVAVRTTRWSRDPHARGSYSINAVGSTRADRVALTRPIEGRLFLAGEATEPDYSGTVHGALLSGRRAARQVIAALDRR